MDVRGALRGIYARRVMRRACGELALTLSCALALLCLIGVADYAWPLVRVARAALVLMVALLSVASVARTVLALARRQTLASISRIIERAARLDENALVTFAESLEGAQMFATEPYIIARLETQARRQLSKLDERAVAPTLHAKRGAIALGSVLILLLLLRLAAPAAFSLEARRLLRLERDSAKTASAGRGANNLDDGKAAGESVLIEEFRVRVVPPAYSGLGVEETAGDAPVRALAGSRVEVLLRVRGNAQGATLSYGGAENSMRATGEGQYAGEFNASASSTLEARVLKDGSENDSLYVVRAVEVFADAPPEVRITEPAGDELLRNVPSAPINVRWTARDDLGLERAVLKYIKSRGEGDAAKFTNGELAPAVFGNAGAREWHGAATLDLARLGVAAGDTLVFWIESRDRNPLANGLGRSQSLAIAIVAPDAPKLRLGDLRPNEIGRFLLSERLIIIHTEKLHGERARLAPEEIKRRAAEIAAEQREFKNSFKDFLEIEGVGGAQENAETRNEQSVEERVRAAEDERTEVHLHDIPEPPAGSPATVKEMVYAIRLMWDAEDALALSDTANALKYEREALAHLKRAQTAVRYIPHVAAESKAVDLKRRYAGELAEIKTQLERLTRRAGSKDSPKIRASLSDAYNALADLQTSLDAQTQARAGAIERARLRVRAAGDRLITLGGEHAATIAEAAAQLRLVETELARVDSSGKADEYAQSLSKSLSLLTQAASNLFALADLRTLSNNGDAGNLLPTGDARAAEYFRRLNGAQH